MSRWHGGGLTEAVGWASVPWGGHTQTPGSPGARSRFHQRQAAPWVVAVARLNWGERLVSLSSPGCGLRAAGHWVMVCSVFWALVAGMGAN